MKGRQIMDSDSLRRLSECMEASNNILNARAWVAVTLVPVAPNQAGILMNGFTKDPIQDGHCDFRNMARLLIGLRAAQRVLEKSVPPEMLDDLNKAIEDATANMTDIHNNSNFEAPGFDPEKAQQAVEDFLRKNFPTNKPQDGIPEDPRDEESGDDRD
jgi:hypothetical protein